MSTEISLGIEFVVPGERYSVIVNGQSETFAAGTMAFEMGPCRMTRAAQLPIEFEYKGTVPTGFDGINRASCTFTKPVETVTVTLTGPATHTERFTLAEPSAEVSFPLPDGTLSVTTKEIVLPGEYEREITVVSVDGETLVISDQPSVLKTVTVLERGGCPALCPRTVACPGQAVPPGNSPSGPLAIANRFALSYASRVGGSGFSRGPCAGSLGTGCKGRQRPGKTSLSLGRPSPGDSKS